MEDIYTFLMILAGQGALFSNIDTSTSKLSTTTRLSQQSISRKLIELEKKGLIQRQATPTGIRVSITPEGRDILKQEYAKLKKLFGKKIVLKGKIVSGIGQGAYYVSAFEKKIREKLGIKPFIGTVNIEVDEKKREHMLSTAQEILIHGFKTRQRSFGWVKCYRIMLSRGNIKQEAVITVPERTVYGKNIIEIISDINLKQKLKLKDNDYVMIEALR